MNLPSSVHVTWTVFLRKYNLIKPSQRGFLIESKVIPNEFDVLLVCETV